MIAVLSVACWFAEAGTGSSSRTIFGQWCRSGFPTPPHEAYERLAHPRVNRRWRALPEPKVETVAKIYYLCIDRRECVCLSRNSACRAVRARAVLRSYRMWKWERETERESERERERPRDIWCGKSACIEWVSRSAPAWRPIYKFGRMQLSVYRMIYDNTFI